MFYETAQMTLCSVPKHSAKFNKLAATPQKLVLVLSSETVQVLDTLSS